MTPAELAKSGTEHAHQRAVIAWANCAALYGFAWADSDLSYDMRTREVLRATLGQPYPIPALKRLFAIHNQGHGDKIRGNRAKAEGVKAGVPDLMLPVIVDCYAGLFIELKKPGKHKVSEDQTEWLDYLNNAGYVGKSAVGWQEATQHIKNYAWPLAR